ncbi:MAG: TPM domain-containing protein [Oscillospiraceae bacterium]|nr:TPM domain-containing protein [Oscillospiraceae bacterium]
MCSKRIASLLAAVCCMMLMVLPASAARQFEDCIPNCKLYDEDGLLSEDEAESLNQLIRQTSDNIDMYVAAYILNGSGSGMTEYDCMVWADDRYDELFNPEAGTDTDGALLLINLAPDVRYIYISTSGTGQLYYYNADENNRVDSIVDRLKTPLRNGDNGGAVREFCSQLEYYYLKGMPNHGYTKDDDTGLYYYNEGGTLVHSESLPLSYRANIPAAVAISVLIGGIAAMIAFFAIRSSYKFKKSLAASNYISNRETNFYQRDDMFIRTYTSKTRISSDSGGGGGGGGHSHSSSGGHSHGGGGGHF